MVYDCDHGLIYCQEQNFNFTCDNLQKCVLNLKKCHLEKYSEKLATFKSLPQLFGLMYFNETWHIYLMALSCFPNTSAKICLIVLEIM